MSTVAPEGDGSGNQKEHAVRQVEEALERYLNCVERYRDLEGPSSPLLKSDDPDTVTVEKIRAALCLVTGGAGLTANVDSEFGRLVIAAMEFLTDQFKK